MSNEGKKLSKTYNDWATEFIQSVRTKVESYITDEIGSYPWNQDLKDKLSKEFSDTMMELAEIHVQLRVYGIDEYKESVKKYYTNFHERLLKIKIDAMYEVDDWLLKQPKNEALQFIVTKKLDIRKEIRRAELFNEPVERSHKFLSGHWEDIETRVNLISDSFHNEVLDQSDDSKSDKSLETVYDWNGTVVSASELVLIYFYNNKNSITKENSFEISKNHGSKKPGLSLYLKYNKETPTDWRRHQDATTFSKGRIKNQIDRLNKIEKLINKDAATTLRFKKDMDELTLRLISWPLEPS